MNHIESKIQQNCVKWFRLQYPKYDKLLFAVPNGGARNKREAGIMKGEGVTAGVSDLILLLSRKGYGALCIEMKSPGGRQEKSQKEWQALVEMNGNKYAVCRSVNEFITQVNEYIL